VRAVADAEEELEALFRAEYRGLVRALSVVAGDVESAADAVQDAFVQAHRHWSRVRRYDQPALWVRRTAVNRILNQHRSRRRRDAAVARLAGPASAGERDLDIGPAVAALPRRQRMAVALHYLADLPVGEVAAAMRVEPGTVKSHLHAARQSLAPLLEVRDDA
jgi:RNA polymerase sigma-70 factor (ECF subfamily)